MEASSANDEVVVPFGRKTVQPSLALAA